MPGRVAKRAIRQCGACDESVGPAIGSRSANKARETHVECESLLLLGWQNRTVPSIRDSQALGRRGLPDRLRSYARRDPVRRGCNYRYGRRGRSNRPRARADRPHGRRLEPAKPQLVLTPFRWRTLTAWRRGHPGPAALDGPLGGQHQANSVFGEPAFLSLIVISERKRAGSRNARPPGIGATSIATPSSATRPAWPTLKPPTVEGISTSPARVIWPGRGSVWSTGLADASQGPASASGCAVPDPVGGSVLVTPHRAAA